MEEIKGITFEIHGDTKSLLKDLDIVEKKVDLITSKLEKAKMLKDQLSDETTEAMPKKEKVITYKYGALTLQELVKKLGI